MRPFFYLSCFLLLAAFGDRHYFAMKEGNEKYRAGDYAGAAQSYAAARNASDSPAARYNEGAALYRMGQYDEAAKLFGSAAEDAKGAISGKASLNFANAQNAAGADHLEKGDAAGAQSALENAVAAYRQTLLKEPDNSPAKHNMEIALKRLADLKQQQRDGKNGKGGQKKDSPKKNGENNRQGETGPDEKDKKNPAGNGKKDGRPERQEDDEARNAPTDPNAMKKEQADRILQSLAQGEEKVQKDMRRYNAQEREVEKDW